MSVCWLISIYLLVLNAKKPHPFGVRFGVYGALGWIRTTDRSVRSRVLYPAELRVHFSLISKAAHYR